MVTASRSFQVCAEADTRAHHGRGLAEERLVIVDQAAGLAEQFEAEQAEHLGPGRQHGDHLVVGRVEIDRGPECVEGASGLLGQLDRVAVTLGRQAFVGDRVVDDLDERPRHPVPGTTVSSGAA